MNKNRFELVFTDSVGVNYFPRYKRFHSTIEEARLTAKKVWEKIDSGFAVGNSPVRSHDAIVYGPGCGQSGTSVNPY